MALAMLFSERPWLFTILFATLTLHAVLALRQPEAPPRWVWALPIVYLLWASIHIQFVYGLFLLGLACAAPLLDRRLGRQQDQTAASPWSRRWVQLVMLSAACFLATLVNPYHVRLYGVVIEYATQPGPFRYINELKAPEFRETVRLGDARPHRGGVLVARPTAGKRLRGAAPDRRRLVRLPRPPRPVVHRPGRPGHPRLGRPAPGSRSAALSADGSAPGRPGAGPGRSRRRLRLGARPVARRAGAPRGEGLPRRGGARGGPRGCTGPLYNDFNWGGYLIWSLPGLPVSIDGRTNLHGDERIERFGRTWAGMPGWDKDPDLAKAGVVIAPADSALASLLRLDSRFEEVHSDDVARVFIARR